MSKERYGYQVTQFDGKIYVFGGLDINNSPIAEVEVFDPVNNTWTTKSNMPTPRRYGSAAVLNGKIYIMGGESPLSNIVEVYDPINDTWSTNTSMLAAKMAFGCVSINNGIYIFGGYIGGGCCNNVELFTLTTPPNVTENLTATAGNTQVSLSWSSVSNATSYTVKRATTAGEPYTTIATGVTTNSYTDTDVVNGTTYYYVVSAVNSGGEGPNSNEASATPTAPQTTGRALLVITMVNGLEKEYDLSMTEVEAFIDWYDTRSTSTGSAYYIFDKAFNLGPFLSRKDYVVYDKIMNFEVMQYE